MSSLFNNLPDDIPSEPEDAAQHARRAWWQQHGHHFLQRAAFIASDAEECGDERALSERLALVVHIVDEVTRRQQGL